MRLAFKNKWGGGFFEREVPIMLRIGTLEDIKDAKGVDFNQMGEMIKTDPDEFMRLLLYHGYLTSCQKRYQKPLYKEKHSYFWYIKMDQEARKEINTQMNVLFGEMQGGNKKKAKAIKY